MTAWIRLVLVAVGYGAALILYLRMAPRGFLSPWFVFAAMVSFLGLAFVARPLVAIRMPEALRRVRQWEARGRVYRALGVHAFGTLLRRTPLRLLNTAVYFRGSTSASTLAAELEAAEASHFWDALLVVPYMVYLGAQGSWVAFSWFCVAQSLVNAYPVAHLRTARHRLDRLARRRAFQ